MSAAERIRAKIEVYAADPAAQANNVKSLQGRPGIRLRVGDWRVIKDGVVLAVHRHHIQAAKRALQAAKR